MDKPHARTRLWPGMVFALIGLNFCVVGVTVYVAHFRHSSFAVESDYDRRALSWDEAARQLRRNTELGWTIGIESTDAGTLSVTFNDANGRPLEGATIGVEAFHHARAGTKITTKLVAIAPGRYSGKLGVDSPGLWEFRFEASRGPEVFTQALTRNVERVETEKLP